MSGNEKNLSLSLWYLLSWCSLLRPLLFFLFTDFIHFESNSLFGFSSVLFPFFRRFCRLLCSFILPFFVLLHHLLLVSYRAHFARGFIKRNQLFIRVTSGFLFIRKRVWEGAVFIYLLIDEHSYFLSFFSSCIITMFCRKKWDRRAKVVSVVGWASCDSLSLPASFRTNLALKGRVCDIWYAEFVEVSLAFRVLPSVFTSVAFDFDSARDRLLDHVHWHTFTNISTNIRSCNLKPSYCLRSVCIF